MPDKPIFEVTNIPQDIQLELNNGTLTLKEGSKVYIPNGSGVFNEVITTTNKTFSFSTNGKWIIVCDSSGNMSRCSYPAISSPTEPTHTFPMLWYDSTNNYCKRWNSYNFENRSFPICIITVSGGAISSIDQVFNGFGYVGSTVFVLPGVEGFSPNGKDGFENLFETITHDSVSVYTYGGSRENSILFFTESSNGIWSYGIEVVNELPNEQDMVSWKRYYNKKDNFVYLNNGSSIVKEKSVPFGYVTTSSSSPYTITSFEIVNPFLKVDLYEYLYANSKPLSQYANSRRFMDLYNNLCGMFSNAKTMEEWYNVVFNLKTASGFGLDLWGKILNQSRQFNYVENGTTEYVYLGGEQTIDGITYSAEYMEEMYRMVLFLKALTYITNCTLSSLNSLLQYYFRDRIDPSNNQNVYVINYGTMEIRYVFQFYVSKIEKSIFTSDVMPRPTGVLANFEFIPYGQYFGFFISGAVTQPYAPFDNKPFYR